MKNDTIHTLAHHVIDAKGLKCPMPIIKLQQYVRKIQTEPTNTTVAIECTDPTAEQDIASWAKVNKQIIEKVEKTEYGCVILLSIQVKT